MRITKVYTRQGDNGQTRLAGGQVIKKSALRLRTFGSVDELNSAIGTVIAFEPCATIREALVRIQHLLFTLGGVLCALEEDKIAWKMPGIEHEHIVFLEELMDKLNENLKPLEDFVLPGGTRVAAFLHQARCVCRRTESLLVELTQEEALEQPLIFLNRLSDALFVMARYENFQANQPEPLWDKKFKQ